MARTVVWTHEAVSDLEAIAEYIARDSAAYAAAVARELRDSGNSLDRFSQWGRIVPETRLTAVRELIVREFGMSWTVWQPVGSSSMTMSVVSSIAKASFILGRMPSAQRGGRLRIVSRHDKRMR